MWPCDQSTHLRSVLYSRTSIRNYTAWKLHRQIWQVISPTITIGMESITARTIIDGMGSNAKQTFARYKTGRKDNTNCNQHADLVCSPSLATEKLCRTQINFYIPTKQSALSLASATQCCLRHQTLPARSRPKIFRYRENHSRVTPASSIGSVVNPGQKVHERSSLTWKNTHQTQYAPS